MNVKKYLTLFLSLILLCGCLTACGEEATPDAGANGAGAGNVPVQKLSDAYADKAYGFQLEMPAEGETVAIMHTNMGDICIRFFPEAAPKTVENFLTHARNGYYNGLTFHRVINDFMIQGGDPKGDGTGGTSIYGSKFEDEFDKKLLNLRGSLAMANSGVNTNGSQFFINQATPGAKSASQLKQEVVEKNNQVKQQYTREAYEQYKARYDAYYGEGYFTTYMYPTYEDFYYGSLVPESDFVPDEVWELYAQQGGNIHLDGAFRYTGGHTVFGQVYQGMDIVDAIAAVAVDSNKKPTVSVIIETIEVTTYTATPATDAE